MQSTRDFFMYGSLKSLSDEKLRGDVYNTLLWLCKMSHRYWLGIPCNEPHYFGEKRWSNFSFTFCLSHLWGENWNLKLLKGACSNFRNTRTPEHQNTEHRNTPEHPGTPGTVLTTRNTTEHPPENPEHPGTPSRKPGTPRNTYKNTQNTSRKPKTPPKYPVLHDIVFNSCLMPFQ